MFQSETLLAGRSSVGSAAADVGVLMDPDGLINVSGTTSTAWGTLVSGAAVGLVGTAQKFRTRVSAQPTPIGSRVLLRVPWTLTTQAGGAVRAQIRADILIDGVSIGSGLGAIRNMDDANGTPYTEVIAVDIPDNTQFAPGNDVDIQVQPQVTTAVGATTFTPTLRHNPAVSADQLVVEVQGTAGVV